MEANSERIPGLRLETRLLYERLLKDEIGQLTTYKELSEIIGFNVQKEGSQWLRSARRKLLNEHHRVHECIVNLGVKRLEDREILEVGDAMIKSARRKVRRAATKVTSVANFDELSNENKIRHNAMLSVMGAIAHVGSSRNRKVIEHKVAAAEKKLPVAKTLQAFTS